MQFSFKSKLFFTFIFYGFSLVLLTQLLVFKINDISLKSASIKKASEIFQEKDKLFKSYVKDTNLKILAISKSNIFNNYLANTKEINLANSLFLDIANTADNIMQLRYIDKNGMEIIRIDRDEFSSKAHLIKKEKLQNKNHRYYFKEILNTNKNEFWNSNLDLNIEHNEIEKPIKPVLRIGTPVFYEGENRGILIINIFMNNFLHELINTPLYEIYFFDDDGNTIVDSTHKLCWSKYLDNNQTIIKNLNEDIDKIIYNKEYYGKNLYSNRIFLDNGENIHMIVKPKLDYIQEKTGKNLDQLIWIMLGVILISFPFSYFFSKTPIKLKEQVDKQKKEQDILLSLFDLSDAVLFKWKNNKYSSVDFVSKSVDKLLGYSQHNFETDSISYEDCIFHDDIKRVNAEIKDAVDKKVYFFKHKPYRIITKDGSIKWILDSTVIVRNNNNKIINFLGYLIDVTALKNSEIKLKILSRTDQLTKVNNRMHIDEILQNQHYRFYRDGEISSIILIDIDFFKSINDNHGHLVGDSVLKEFALLIQSSIRKSDILGRWGGEEFLIILPHTNLIQAMQLAKKLRKTVDENIFSVVKHKTASFGVATFIKGMSIETLIDSADKALYISKDSGRNRVTEIQSPSM